MPAPSSTPITLAILVGAASLGLLVSAIYVPSIPDMARDFGVSVGQIQLTLTVFLAAFAASTLIVGPLSDRLGRRTVLLAGTGLCVAGSAIGALAGTVEILYVGRVLQALGGCAGIVIARAMVRDLFDRDGTVRAMAVLAMAVTLVPILAPIIGGSLHVVLGWRSTFWAVTLFSALMLGAIALLPETNLNLQNQVGMLRGMVMSFTALLRVRRFVGYALATACGGVTFYSFVVAAPVILIDHMGVRPDVFGLYNAVPPVGFFCGSFLSSRRAAVAGIDTLILIGGIGHIAAGAVLILLVLGGFAEPWAVIGPLVIMGFSNGLIMPNAYAGGVSVHPHLAGAAAGFGSFVQMLGAAVATFVLAAVPLNTAVPMGLAFLIAGAVIVLGFRWLARD
jgi:DHA1 family bicyclomycin/chloramphenicol resistance-like MFS transporter